MTLHLRITKAPDGTSPSQTVHAIDEAGGTLGRGPDNTLMLPDPERILSSRHCEFVHQGGQYQIVDWSTNGTFLNSSSEPLGKGTSAALNHGDIIEVGDYCFSVELATAMDTGVQNTPFAPASSPFATSEAPPSGTDFAVPDDPFQSDPFGALPEPAPVNGHDSLDPLQLLDGVSAPRPAGEMLASAWVPITPVLPTALRPPPGPLPNRRLRRRTLSLRRIPAPRRWPGLSPSRKT